MIPIKYFWTNSSPTDEEIRESMTIAEDENCVVVLYWKVFGYRYSMTARKGMTFEECKKQIPTIYGA